MYKTILVPMDGSKRAETILPHVEQLARQNNARVVFIEVLEPNAAMVTPYDMVPYIDAEALEQRKAEAANYLAGLVGEFREKGIDAKQYVEQGPVVRTILDVADRESAEIVAMASHGRTGLARVFYGSVAAGVLAAADRPLLIVRAEKAG
jgi:nucleotide-binding universal stress UspA family protein